MCNFLIFISIWNLLFVGRNTVSAAWVDVLYEGINIEPDYVPAIQFTAS